MRYLRSITAAVAAVVFVSVPSYTQTQFTIPPGAIVINLDTSGALRIDQESTDSSKLTDRLRSIATSDATVVILAAADVAYKELVSTVEKVREAGIDHVGILKAQPGGSVRESLPPIGATVLSVDRTGVVRLDGKKTKPTELTPRLKKLFNRRTDRTVYVEAYGSLRFDTVGNIIDAAKAAGASRIGLVASNQ
jgi:biopolymer transport protein ExbD